jgi:hypothetical protein
MQTRGKRCRPPILAMNFAREAISEDNRPDGEERQGECQDHQHCPHGDLPSKRGTTFVCSTTNAKGARRRLDFDFAAVLTARRKPECAARGLYGHSAGAFVWIVNKLVQSD